MEPSPHTLTAVGILCVTYASLEHTAEATIWGLLDVNQRLGPILTHSLDLRNRLQRIVEYAEGKHSAEDIELLKQINKQSISVVRDRNIIVHGIIHQNLTTQLPSQIGDMMVIGVASGKAFAAGFGDTAVNRPPCWTIFKGESKGKSFPVSVAAVNIVVQNIMKLQTALLIFNRKHGYTLSSTFSDDVEQNWPTPL